MEIEFTKIKLLYEEKNDMTHNFYYMKYGRIYNETHTKYRKFKYVECFNIFDVQEYYEDCNYKKDYQITKKDIKNYAIALDTSLLYSIQDFNDTKGLQDFYTYCCKTIQYYNRIIGYH